MPQNYVSTAVATKLSAGISSGDTSLTLAASTGWPSAPFVATIDRGTAQEEQVYVATRSGTSCSNITRGYGGTAAVSHGANAPVEHTIDAPSLQRWEDHLANTSAHTAANIAFTPTGNLAATTVSAALAELDNEKASAATLNEDIRDAIGSALVAGTNISLTVDDPNNTITVANTVDPIARANHTGTQASSTISDFTEAVQDVVGALTGFGGDGLTYTYNDSSNSVSLVANVDNSTLAIVSDQIKVKDNGVALAQLAAAIQDMLVPTAVIMAYGAATAPTGWLLCDGAAVNRTTYSALFAIVGTLYGSGNGTSTFNVPDLRGRVPVGKDDLGGTAQNRITNAVSGITGTSLGSAGGSQSHTLTTAELPAHNHYANSNTSFTGGVTAGSDFSVPGYGGYTDNAGSGNAHRNVQPSLIVGYIIKT